MIIVDTNVVSELMYEDADPNVVNWFSAQDLPSLHLTTVTESELWFRVELMPMGRNRQEMFLLTESMLTNTFSDRILVFDRGAARRYATIAADRRARGLSVDHPDCQIAAIAVSVGAAVATRNVSDFEGSGIDVINPWDYTP